MHCYTRPTQVRNRCILGGKTRGILRDFKLSRVSRVRWSKRGGVRESESLRNGADDLAVQLQVTGAGRQPSRCEEGQLVKRQGPVYDSVQIGSRTCQNKQLYLETRSPRVYERIPVTTDPAAPLPPMCGRYGPEPVFLECWPHVWGRPEASTNYLLPNDTHLAP